MNNIYILAVLIIIVLILHQMSECRESFGPLLEEHQDIEQKIRKHILGNRLYRGKNRMPLYPTRINMCMHDF